MIWLCRLPLLIAFALHWGGLTLYTGFVVRVAHDVLSDPMDGGLITQQVTTGLQYLGVLTLILMALNAWLVLRQTPRLGRVLLACVVLLAIALVGLFATHGALDAVIDVRAAEITDRDAFTAGHRRYNQFTTLQWLAALAYLPTTLLAWHVIDSENTIGLENTKNG